MLHLIKFDQKAENINVEFLIFLLRNRKKSMKTYKGRWQIG